MNCPSCGQTMTLYPSFYVNEPDMYVCEDCTYEEEARNP